MFYQENINTLLKNSLPEERTEPNQKIPLLRLKKARAVFLPEIPSSPVNNSF